MKSFCYHPYVNLTTFYHLEYVKVCVEIGHSFVKHMSRHVSSMIDSTLEVEAYVIIAFANFKLKLF